MKIEGISASSYNTYDHCEWKWFLSYSLGIEDIAGGAALLGQVCHDVFETMSIASIEKKDLSSDDFDIDKQWNLWLKFYKDKNPEIFETIKADKIRKIKRGVDDLITGKYNRYTPITEKTLCAEQYFKLEIKEERFRLPKEAAQSEDQQYFAIKGFIDRIDQIDDDTLEIIDYKTGSRSSFLSDDKTKKNSAMLREDIQPRMYHLAAKHLYPHIKHFIITFIYTTDGGPVSTIVSDEDLEEVKDIIYNKFQEVKNNEDPFRNESWKCRFCHFSKQNTNLCDELYDEKESLGKDGMQFLENKFKIINPKSKRR